MHQVTVAADLGPHGQPRTPSRQQIESKHHLRPDGGAVRRDHAQDGPRAADQLPRLPAAAHAGDAEDRDHLVQSTEKPGGIGEPATALIGAGGGERGVRADRQAPAQDAVHACVARRDLAGTESPLRRAFCFARLLAAGARRGAGLREGEALGRRDRQDADGRRGGMARAEERPPLPRAAHRGGKAARRGDHRARPRLEPGFRALRQRCARCWRKPATPRSRSSCRCCPAPPSSAFTCRCTRTRASASSWRWISSRRRATATSPSCRTAWARRWPTST